MHRIRTDRAGPTLAEAITGYLATLDHPETAGTLTALHAELGADHPVVDLAEPAAAAQLAAWFTGRWGARAPATFNRNLDALRAAIRYCHDQGWLDPSVDPTRSLRRRGRARPHQSPVPRPGRDAARPRGPRPSGADPMAAAV